MGLLGVRGWGLEGLPEHESRIFSPPGLALDHPPHRHLGLAEDRPESIYVGFWRWAIGASLYVRQREPDVQRYQCS